MPRIVYFLYRCLVTIGFILIFSINIEAQEIKIKSFSLQMEPMTVPMQRTDANGNVCALVKVIIPNAQASFEGSLIGDCAYKTSEYWCYLSPGSKQLKIKYPGCEPLMVNFELFIGSGLKSKQIYELVVIVPTIPNYIGKPLQGKVQIEGHILTGDFKGIISKLEEMRKLFPDLKICHKGVDGHIQAEIDFGKELINRKFDAEPLRYFFQNVAVGDYISINCSNRLYEPLDICVTSEIIESGNYDISFMKRKISIQGTAIDSESKKPIPNIKIHCSTSYLSKEDESITDENGVFCFDSKTIDEKYLIYFNTANNIQYYLKTPYIYEGHLPDYYKDYKLEIMPKHIFGRVILQGDDFDRIKVMTEDGILGKIDSNGNFDIVPYSENPSLIISSKGYKTISIQMGYFGGDWNYHCPAVKLEKGNEGDIVYMKLENGKLKKEKIK